ncbi:MAG: L,D-transpeptidase [Opitutae bacterium]|nr:L,D-transpeptidase [Opitutae bacterium]
MSFDLINKEKYHLEQSCEALSILPSRQQIIISIKRQSLYLINEDNLVKEYIVSTSKNPPSCLENSYGTPLGLHCIEEKIGNGEPIGTVFKGRVAQDYTYEQAPQFEQATNLITTRILRIKGLDPDLNLGDPHDSYNRYIYIHGTNHEERLGKPFSKGCIELANKDCMDLFSLVHSGDLIWIE